MEDNEKMVTITVVHNGPLIVDGEFRLIDKDGKESIQKGKTALCRCGHSAHKPFCDGTHLKINWEDDKYLS